jgi:predicted enzyme related to lactoylglutathione lyase
VVDNVKLLAFGRIWKVAIYVNDLDEAVGFYGALFGTKFTRHRTKIKQGNFRWAGCPLRFELVERLRKGPQQDTVRSIHFKVADVQRAKKKLRAKGITPYEEVRMGKLREVVYHIRGLRIILIDWKG